MKTHLYTIGIIALLALTLTLIALFPTITGWLLFYYLIWLLVDTWTEGRS